MPTFFWIQIRALLYYFVQWLGESWKLTLERNFSSCPWFPFLSLSSASSCCVVSSFQSCSHGQHKWACWAVILELSTLSALQHSQPKDYWDWNKETEWWQAIHTCKEFSNKPFHTSSHPYSILYCYHTCMDGRMKDASEILSISQGRTQDSKFKSLSKKICRRVVCLAASIWHVIIIFSTALSSSTNRHCFPIMTPKSLLSHIWSMYVTYILLPLSNSACMICK